jgi:hypothetical protein
VGGAVVVNFFALDFVGYKVGLPVPPPQHLEPNARVRHDAVRFRDVLQDEV